MKMKRFILPLIAILLLGVTSSCTDEYYIYQNVTQTHEYTVSGSQWVTSDNVNYYYASFNNADITSAIEEHGTVVAYVFDDGRWNPLPYVYPYSITVEDQNTGELVDITIAENIRFDWTTNEVTFIMQDLDGGMPEGVGRLPTMTFKVCVLQ